MRSLCLLLSLFGLMAVAGIGVSSHAETVRLELASLPFYERYDGKAPVSGMLLVGLQLGTSTAHFDPSRIGVTLPKEALGGNLCVAIASEDGRYAARNLYVVPKTAGHEALLTTEPKTPDQLKKYQAGDIAVTARATDQCESAGVGPLVPVILNSGEKPDHDPGFLDTSLMVYVNEEPERIAVRLVKGQDEVAVSGPCTTFRSHTRISFTSRCSIPIGRIVPDGTYDLELTVKGAFKALTEKYAMFLVRP